jgi:hypothetical protein
MKAPKSSQPHQTPTAKKQPPQKQTIPAPLYLAHISNSMQKPIEGLSAAVVVSLHSEKK